MKKLLVLLLAVMMVMPALVACGGNAANNGGAADKAPMQYISVADAQKDLGNADVLFIDNRKAADYDKGHIDGAILADMDKAKGGDLKNGEEAMKKAIGDAKDKKIILVCYSGKSYAQAGTDVLKALGYDMSKVYTLEGGMKAWDADSKK